MKQEILPRSWSDIPAWYWRTRYSIGLPVLVTFLVIKAFDAFGADVDFSTVITDADDAPIVDCTGSECAGKPPLTLGKLAMRSLTAVFPDEQNLSGEDKFRRGQLAMRVYKGGTADITVEDASLIKRLIAKGYGPLIVLRAWPLLDPAVK